MERNRRHSSPAMEGSLPNPLESKGIVWNIVLFFIPNYPVDAHPRFEHWALLDIPVITPHERGAVRGNRLMLIKIMHLRYNIAGRCNRAPG